MANIKISERIAATLPLTAAETIGLIQSGLDRKCTVEDISPYYVLRGYLNQSGTSDPTITIVKNTTGVTPVLAYSTPGVYSLTMTGVFTALKTWIGIRRQVLATDKEATYARTNADSILIQSFTTSTGTNGNSLLSDTPIEILIYK